jgi:hypothetical protein
MSDAANTRFIVKFLSLVTLFIEIIFVFISVIILPYKMKLLTSLISCTLIWGIYTVSNILSFILKKKKKVI